MFWEEVLFSNIGHDFYKPLAPIILDNNKPNNLEIFREKFYVKATKSGRGE